MLELSFGELIPTGYVIYFSWLPQTPLSIITQDPATVIEAKRIIDTLKTGGGTGTISLGAPEDLAWENVLPAGGMITINNPANPLHAMEIIVPPGAYTAAKPFRVSSAPITSHTFGPLFQPLTPLINVLSVF